MQTITRKELSALLDCSVKTIERREHDYGLTRFKIRHRVRPILYLKAGALNAVAKNCVQVR